MIGRPRTLLAIAACMLMTPVAAQAPAPTTTAFDGVYTGLSREAFSYAESKSCAPIFGPPPTLTIIDGLIRARGGMEGRVSADGRLVLRTPNSWRIDGQIDSRGGIKGQANTYHCAVTYVWQKEPATTAAFDGKYIGVRRESPNTVSASGVECAPDGVPAPLTITYGVVDSAWGWDGTVNLRGAVAMWNPKWKQVDAQIDAQGTIKGQTSGTDCLTTFVWRKQSS